MYIQLLRKGYFVFLWLAQIASTLAVQLYKIGVMVVIFAQTGSTLQAAGVLVATSLPHVVLGPVAGALVDRYPRKAVLIVVELSRALLVGLSLYLATSVVLNVWVIYGVVAGLSIADAFYKPALLSMLPSLVEKSAIVHANSLVNGTNYGVMGVGYALGGYLILHVGLSTIVIINMALFLIAALLVTRIVVVPALIEMQVHKAPDPIWRSIRDGLAYLRHHDLSAFVDYDGILRALAPRGVDGGVDAGLYNRSVACQRGILGLSECDLFWRQHCGGRAGGSLCRSSRAAAWVGDYRQRLADGGPDGSLCVQPKYLVCDGDHAALWATNGLTRCGTGFALAIYGG